MAKKASDAIVSQTGNHFYGAGGLVAIAAFFGNYVNFTGRSTRREYWWWTLWHFLLGAIYWGIIIGSVGLTSLKKDPTSLIMSMLGFLLVALLFSLAILLPSLALGVRRFRDAGVHWGVYVALQVATVVAVFLLHDQSTIQSILTVAISLVSLVIAILPTKNPPVDETDSWAEA
jgi:uncharacterized membrane protein YhaH (DUF805 family)